MKINSRFLLALLVFETTAFTLTAQDAGAPPRFGDGPPPQGGPGPDRRPPPSPIIAALDANGDGIIDADEIANASAALKKLDKNGDGSLTEEEFRPMPPGGGRGPNGPAPGARQRPGPNSTGLQDRPEPDHPQAPMPPLLAALDLNHDGIIDADEIAKAPDSLKTLDKNGDGQLTPDEFRPPRRTRLPLSRESQK